MSDMAGLLQDFARALDAPTAPDVRAAPRRANPADLLAALGITQNPEPLPVARRFPRIVPAPAKPKFVQWITPARVACPAPERIADQPRPNLRAMIEEQVAADPDRLPWPESWWHTPDSGVANSCRAMWQTALRELLADALRDVIGLKPRADVITCSANRAWLGSRDFHMVCALAGMDGIAVEDRVTAAIATEAGAASFYRGLCQHGEAADERIENLRRTKRARGQRNAA